MMCANDLSATSRAKWVCSAAPSRNAGRKPGALTLTPSFRNRFIGASIPIGCPGALPEKAYIEIIVKSERSILANYYLYGNNAKILLDLNYTPDAPYTDAATLQPAIDNQIVDIDEAAIHQIGQRAITG